MVDDVFGQQPGAIEGAGRVELHRHRAAQVGVLAHAPHPRGLVIVARADAPSDHVPVSPAADQGHALQRHDGGELVADLARAPERLGVQEVAHAPRVRVVVAAPLRVHVQEGEVVRFGDGELVARRVGFVLAFLGPVEDAGDGEHGDDGEHLGGAGVFDIIRG